MSFHQPAPRRSLLTHRLPSHSTGTRPVLPVPTPPPPGSPVLPAPVLPSPAPSLTGLLPPNTGHYREITTADLTKGMPWTSSPRFAPVPHPRYPPFPWLTPLVVGDEGIPGVRAGPPKREETLEGWKSDRRRSRRRRGLALLKRAIRDIVGLPTHTPYPRASVSSSSSSSSLPPYTLVAPEDWKAFAYWARPCINKVQVDNAAPPRTPPPLPLPALAAALRGPTSSPHPSIWPAQLSHPSLPPRPSTFPAPTPGAPLPFPWECQLNPFLHHRSAGLPVLTFDLTRSPQCATLAESPWAAAMYPDDLAQPATAPLVTHMHVGGLADEWCGAWGEVASSTTAVTAATNRSGGRGGDAGAAWAKGWPWPVMVRNTRGVSVGDVLWALFENLQQFVSREEWEGMGSRRRGMARRAFEARVEREGGGLVGMGAGVNGGGGGGGGVARRAGKGRAHEEGPGLPGARVGAAEEGVRRVDYLGDRVMFRGLEPAPGNDGTWVMFIGPPPPW